MADRNFDDLADKFARKIYGGSKGAVRMAVLERDLKESGLLDIPPSQVLELGGGFGLFAQKFAKLGSTGCVVDISEKMLEQGKTQWTQARQQSDSNHDWGTIQWFHQSIQETTGTFPFVCCHAVLEWVDKPKNVLEQVCERVDKNGVLSLMAFNQVALIWKNVLFGRAQKVLDGRLHGFGNSLTPKHSFTIEQLHAWLDEFGFDVEITSGVRVFHDFLQSEIRNRLWKESDSLLALELKYSRDPIHQQMGRYIHIVCRKRA